MFFFMGFIAWKLGFFLEFMIGFGKFFDKIWEVLVIVEIMSIRTFYFFSGRLILLF